MSDIIVPVALTDRPYDIVIGAGLLRRAADYLSPLSKGRPLTIIADANVTAHLEHVQGALNGAGIASHAIIIPSGEASKSWDGLAKLCDDLIALGVERSDHIIALGGGVVGDLVGFASAILKRGCAFVQIPTTLLADVDSSVGGKTAINTAAGKNLIGQFHQPALVLIDPEVLSTLPPRQMRAGYAEVVKYGLIDDAAFFDWCTQNGAQLLAGDRAAQVHAIHRSVRAKAVIVAADERETRGVRALLNLGHTFGHALEAEAGFSDTLLHGEAVAAGMALAFGYSVRRGLCSAADAARVRAHLAEIGLPHSLASAGIKADGTRLVAHMAHDKKAVGGCVPFILARGIGMSFVAADIDLADVAAFLDDAE